MRPIVLFVELAADATPVPVIDVRAEDSHDQCGGEEHGNLGRKRCAQCAAGTDESERPQGGVAGYAFCATGTLVDS